MTTNHITAIAERMTGLTPEAIADAIQSPDWTRGRGASSWVRFVPTGIQDEWDGLTDDARVIALIFADQQRREAALQERF